MAAVERHLFVMAPGATSVADEREVAQTIQPVVLSALTGHETGAVQLNATGMNYVDVVIPAQTWREADRAKAAVMKALHGVGYVTSEERPRKPPVAQPSPKVAGPTRKRPDDETELTVTITIKGKAEHVKSRLAYLRSIGIIIHDDPTKPTA